MGKSTPDAPDYTAAAQAQAQSSRNANNAQTVANRPDQYTPFGSQTWNSQESFDNAAYGRALQDWQAQGARLGKDANNPDYLALRPQQNDFYSTQWDQTTTLTPEAQRALDAQLGLQSGRSELAGSLLPRAQQEFGQAMDWSGFSPMSFGPQATQYGANPQAQQIQRNLSNEGLPGLDPSQTYYDQAGDAIFNQWSNRNEPQMQRQSEQLETRLRNQGLNPGDQAYDQALSDLRMSQGDARTNASYQATIGAGQEASRMFGMDSSARGQLFGERGTQGAFANDAANQALGQDLNLAQFGDTRANTLFGQGLQSANFTNQVRQQQIAEAMQKRGFSLNEINAIISGQQVGMPSMPGFNSAGKAEGVQYNQAAQNQYSANLDAANAQNAGMGNLLGGATQLASTAMMFSDRRLKKDVRKVAEYLGIPVYEFHYVWQEDRDPLTRGVMSDEVPAEFVVKHSSGYDMVDYGKLVA